MSAPVPVHSGVDSDSDSPDMMASAIDQDEMKRHLQQQFTDGLVTIIGSGLSTAAGLPTMGDLAEHLRSVISSRSDQALHDEWNSVAARLIAGDDLESALADVAADSQLVGLIIELTASFIGEAEVEAVKRVLAGTVDLPLRRLLGHLAFSGGPTHIITSNYDRLVELAAELSGIPVDTGFTGHHYGRFDVEATKEAQFRYRSLRRAPHVSRSTRPHVALHKPHGSLDWFVHENQPVSCWAPIDTQRLMITPGSAKYRLGYDAPFDRHRTRANDAIESATGFLVIGYGFNDDHLETMLRRKIREGRPCILLTKSLTVNAERLVGECPSILALSDATIGDAVATACTWRGVSCVFSGSSLWSLSSFISEVLS